MGGVGHSGAAVEEGAQIGFAQVVAALIEHLIHLCEELQHGCVIPLPAGLAGFGNDVQLGVAVDRGGLIRGCAHHTPVLLLPLQGWPRAGVLCRSLVLVLLLLLLLLLLILVLELMLMVYTPLWPVAGFPVLLRVRTLLLVRWSPCRPAGGVLLLVIMLVVALLLLLRWLPCRAVRPSLQLSLVTSIPLLVLP